MATTVARQRDAACENRDIAQVRESMSLADRSGGVKAVLRRNASSDSCSVSVSSCVNRWRFHSKPKFPAYCSELTNLGTPPTIGNEWPFAQTSAPTVTSAPLVVSARNSSLDAQVGHWLMRRKSDFNSRSGSWGQV